MTKQKKVVLSGILLLVIMLVTVTPTLAWLSDGSDSVVNYFGGGAIAIILDEADVDASGSPIEDASRVTENHYKYMAGSVLTKDPTVTVLADSENCYVYVCVDNQLPMELFTLDFNLEEWIVVAEMEDMTIYRYVDVVESSEEDQVLTPIFTQVEVSADLTADDINALGTRTVTVTAFAIQALALEEDEADELAQAYFFDGEEIALEDDGIQYTNSETSSANTAINAGEINATNITVAPSETAGSNSTEAVTSSAENEAKTSGAVNSSTDSSLASVTEDVAEDNLTAEDETGTTAEASTEANEELDLQAAVDETTEVAEGTSANE